MTAVLNGAPFVAEAIQSVLQQSLRDWELLVVDDGLYRAMAGSEKLLRYYANAISHLFEPEQTTS